jgi:hypothetical protein
MIWFVQQGEQGRFFFSSKKQINHNDAPRKKRGRRNREREKRTESYDHGQFGLKCRMNGKKKTRKK